MRPGIHGAAFAQMKQYRSSFNEAQAMRPGIRRNSYCKPCAYERASMRPRPCGPGYTNTYPRPRHVSRRFNEAQAMRPGIPRNWPSLSAIHYPLQ